MNGIGYLPLCYSRTNIGVPADINAYKSKAQGFSTVYKIQTELQDVLNEVYTLSIISSILVPHHESLTS